MLKAPNLSKKEYQKWKLYIQNSKKKNFKKKKRKEK